jgi:hypothetical protein
MPTAVFVISGAPNDFRFTVLKALQALPQVVAVCSLDLKGSGTVRVSAAWQRDLDEAVSRLQKMFRRTASLQHTRWQRER